MHFRTAHLVSIFSVLVLSRPLPAADATATRLTLPTAVSEALARSPYLEAGEAEIDAARGEVLSARTRANPDITFSPGIRRLRESEGSRHEFLGSLELSQTILFPGKRELLIALAERNVELRKLGVEGVRFQLTIAVRKAFYELLAAQSTLAVRQQQLSSAEVFHQAATQRAKGGYSSDFEVVKSQGDVISARKAVNAAEGEVAAARVELNALLGRELTAELTVEGSWNSPDDLPVLSDLLAIALRENPSLRAQTIQAEIGAANLRKARLARKPDFTVGPSIEYSRSEQILSLNATVPWIGKNTGRGEIASASAEQRRISAETEKLRRELSAAVAKAFVQLQAARAQLALYSPSYLNQLKETVSLAEQSYAQNATSLLIYLESKRTYFDTLADYNEAIVNVAASRIALEAALGVPFADQNSTPSSTTP
jgi:outer membrane protein TolC